MSCIKKACDIFAALTQQQSASARPMVALYAARIEEDLGPGDFVSIRCIACGHDMLIPPSSLLHGLRLPPNTVILNLEPRLRCRECDARGKAVVSIKCGLNAAAELAELQN